MASTEWFLGVRIQNFVNQYNVEIINGDYCCCDDNERCGSNLNHLFFCKHPNITQVCETYFVIHMKNCLYGSACSVIKTYHLNYTLSDSIFNHGVLAIPVMETGLGYEVRTKISYFFQIKGKI